MAGLPAVDLSEFEELSKPHYPRCTVGIALDGLEGQEREQFAAALGTPAITHTAIQTWLGKRDIKISDQTVARHRQRRCSCDA